MRKSKLRFLFAVALAVTGEISSATSVGCLVRYSVFPDSLVLNVSTAGWATKDQPVMACTIINPEIKSYGVAFFAETDTEDAAIEVKYVGKNFPTRYGDDWKQDIPASQMINLPVNLRTPARDTDAVVILHTDSAFYPVRPSDLDVPYATYRFGVCAFGYPKSGRAWTSVSISTLKSFSCPSQGGNVPPVNYFEH